MVFIYVLRLKNDKYYVGKTENPKFRIDTHFKNGGCYWTKKYKPCQIIGLFPECDDFDEDKYTLKYMSKYGVDNVRGGSFCRCDLSIENKNTINKMISSSNDCCHFCGEKGHFIGNCTKEKEKNRYSKQNKHFLELSKDYESADEVEWENDEESEEDISPENLETAFSEMDKDDGLYSFDGNKYLWCDGELYEESPHDNCGARDGTFYTSEYGDNCILKQIKKKKRNKQKNHQNVIDVGEMVIINHHVMLRNILKVFI